MDDATFKPPPLHPKIGKQLLVLDGVDVQCMDALDKTAMIIFDRSADQIHSETTKSTRSGNG